MTTSKPVPSAGSRDPALPFPGPAAGSRRTRRLLAVVAVVLANLAVWAVAVPVAGADLLVRTGGDTRRVTPLAVATVSLLAALAGWALLATMERRARSARWARHTRAAWALTALAVLALSLVGPVTAAVDAEAGVVLAGMHLVTGAVLVPVLFRSACR